MIIWRLKGKGLKNNGISDENINWFCFRVDEDRIGECEKKLDHNNKH